MYLYARVCDLADLARVVHLPWLLVERLVQPHGGLRRGQVDEAVAHIALVAAVVIYFILYIEKTRVKHDEILMIYVGRINKKFRMVW